MPREPDPKRVPDASRSPHDLLVAPSVLAADFARLGEEVGAAERAGADWIHLDVMDGAFVPNISFGPPVIRACRRSTALPLDAHLMIDAPERYLEDVVEAGADGVTVHAEATPHLHRALQRIAELGARPGLAVNPLTPLEVVREALPWCGLVLVMTVNPGFGGQSFLETSVERVRRVAAWRDRLAPECRIEVDGGISPATAGRVAAAGADVLVAGSAVFGHDDVAERVRALRAAAAAG